MLFQAASHALVGDSSVYLLDFFVDAPPSPRKWICLKPVSDALYQVSKPIVGNLLIQHWATRYIFAYGHASTFASTIVQQKSFCKNRNNLIILHCFFLCRGVNCFQVQVYYHQDHQRIYKGLMRIIWSYFRNLHSQCVEVVWWQDSLKRTWGLLFLHCLLLLY